MIIVYLSFDEIKSYLNRNLKKWKASKEHPDKFKDIHYRLPGTIKNVGKRGGNRQYLKHYNWISTN